MKQTPVAERALIARIKRALAKKAEVLFRCREDSKWFRELGRFYVSDSNRHLVQTDVDLEQLGRELGVLRSGEVLAR